MNHEKGCVIGITGDLEGNYMNAYNRRDEDWKLIGRDLVLPEIN